MATVWIVTIGNSDVQLRSMPDDWIAIRDQQQDRLSACRDSLIKEEGFFKHQSSNFHVLPARLTGLIFSENIETHWQYLQFPLLDGFCDKLQSLENPIIPDQIILLLTDQDNVDTGDRSNLKNPYWKDTISLQPILEKFLKQKFPSSKIQAVILKPPQGKIGLDDWNMMLGIVDSAFEAIDLSGVDQIILSHQAGTPATSSAVQFVSLSQFGGTVSFLLGNERTKNVSITSYSSYFESMQIQEAQNFLKNYDYVSVSSVLQNKLERLKEQNADQADKILKLLGVANQWNLSKFDEFETAMKNLPIENLRNIATARFSDSWNWWIAYEEAYLGIIRRRQGNIVEAFFHSFRAFEGIFAEWGNKIFKGNENIIIQKDIPCLKKDALEGDCKKYLAGSDLKSLREELSKEGILPLELMTLCKIFKKNRPDYKPTKCPDIVIFWDNDNEKRISARRNFIFHQVQGIAEDQLLNFWQTKFISEWEDKLRKFLNFIAEQNFDAWEEASLMAQVHKELVKEIEKLQKS